MMRADSKWKLAAALSLCDYFILYASKPESLHGWYLVVDKKKHVKYTYVLRISDHMRHSMGEYFESTTTHARLVARIVHARCCER